MCYNHTSVWSLHISWTEAAMHTSHSEMVFQLCPSVGQMCNTFLTAIAKTVSDQSSCCVSSHRPISRSRCWQQSYCMFGLIALHPWFIPSLMCAHVPPGSLGKVAKVHTSEQGGRWQPWQWNEIMKWNEMKWNEMKWKCTYRNEKVMQPILGACGQILSKTTS